jgi:hypothetical protein
LLAPVDCVETLGELDDLLGVYIDPALVCDVFGVKLGDAPCELEPPPGPEGAECGMLLAAGLAGAVEWLGGALSLSLSLSLAATLIDNIEQTAIKHKPGTNRRLPTAICLLPFNTE